MLTLRPANERGHANFGWLDSYHTFSFGQYVDPRHMGFRSLRVINEDRVAPGQGFGIHSHRDMEILTVVLEGAVSHKDSIGNVATIRPGEVQRMSAGTGIAHSEYNPSSTEPTHFLQIWILPEKDGLQPSYEQAAFPLEDRLNQLRLIASRDGRDGSVTVHQDVQLYTATLDAKQELTYSKVPERYVWLQVTRGDVTVNDKPLHTGDGMAVSEESMLTITAIAASEVLVFDLA
jgi:quercetin 2,3-dioxygenase